MTDKIYDGSFKNETVRFFTLIDTVTIKKNLNIYYTGKVTTKPVVKNNIISYSLSVTSLQAAYLGSNKILYYADDRNLLAHNEITMEATLFKKNKNLYMMLGFPENNVAFTQHPGIIRLIKP